MNSNIKWINNIETINWNELSTLYKIAPLGDKAPELLEQVFKNSMFKYFVYDNNKLVGVGRALADGADCSYICDVAIHPNYQGRGLGKAIIKQLIDDSKEHKKIILYAVPSKEPFYAFKMKMAMAILKEQEWARVWGWCSKN